ncbi:MAG TPA: hypothetical protein PLA82_03605 [Deltaproteobacteria bacterium]|nr:hypothetical protein [Deltaproteobacteria bacterium]
MDMITREDLKLLAGKTDGVRISIYLPTHRAGKETQQGAIRLKNLLREAEEHQPGSGLRSPELRAMLGPAQKLIGDPLFWKYQSDGLALFLSEEGLTFYRLPIRFHEQLVVGRRFYIKPLFPFFIATGHYFILAISMKEVRLLQCSRFSSSDVDLPSVPENISEVFRLDSPEKLLQFHARAGPITGAHRRRTLLHGHGTGVGDEKADLLNYFHRINRGLRQRLRDERAPLVLAGVGYLLPIYHEANTYPCLLDEGIEGNPEEMSAAELKRLSWEIIRPHFTQERMETAERYRQLSTAGSDRASEDLAKVVPAAYSGRIDTLFVAVGDHRWGSFDPLTTDVNLHDEPEEGDEDLLDFAAVQTFLNGGGVYAERTGTMPTEAPLAAIMRY